MNLKATCKKNKFLLFFISTENCEKANANLIECKIFFEKFKTNQGYPSHIITHNKIYSHSTGKNGDLVCMFNTIRQINNDFKFNTIQSVDTNEKKMTIHQKMMKKI